MQTFINSIPLAKEKILERLHEGMGSIFSGHNPSPEDEGLARKDAGLDQQPYKSYLADNTRSTNTV